MTKEAYGIPVPRGVRRDWKAWPVQLTLYSATLRHLGVPAGWGTPSNCVAWHDRFDRRRLIVAHFTNGRSATVRIDANGVWKTTFGEVPA